MRYILISIFLLSSCCAYESSPYMPYVEKISSDFIYLATTKYNLRVEGTGGGCFQGVNSIWVGLGSDETVDIDEARAQILALAQEFIAKIESEPRIRPYVKNPDKIGAVAEISLSYTGRIKRAGISVPVAYVTLARGKISYAKIQRQTGQLICMHRETYEDALEILRRQNS